MLSTFKWMGMRPIGLDAERVVRTLRASGGRLEHSVLLRKLIYFVNAPQFKNAIDTLVQSGLIKEHLTTNEHWYELTEESGSSP